MKKTHDDYCYGEGEEKLLKQVMSERKNEA